jgi:protein TonB
MSETATLRATSLLASTGILGGLVIVALTFTYVLEIADPFPDAPTFETVREPPPTPPPPEPVHQPVRLPTTVADPMDTILPSQPIDPTTDIADGPPAQFVAQEITVPQWLRRPRNLQRYYPRGAIARGVEGMVVLDCMVATTGALRCQVISETPREWGFGDAALRIAAEHRMEPARSNGAPVEGRYRMRVPFRAE